MIDIKSTQASNLELHLSKNLKEKISKEKLVFGKTFTDHMMTVEWTKTSGWSAPTIKPYGPISLNPSSSVFHYATEVYGLL